MNTLFTQSRCETVAILRHFPAIFLVAWAIRAYCQEAGGQSLYTPYAFTNFAGMPGGPGTNDGVASAARFNFPSGVAVDGSGNLYVADQGNNTIRKIAPSGLVTLLAGSIRRPGINDGAGATAQFNSPFGVAVDVAGNVYVADSFNSTIRKVSPAGVVVTLAGNPGHPGTNDGIGSEASFFQPTGVAVDSAGFVYVADIYNHTIRKITPQGSVTTLAGTPGQEGSVDGSGKAARFSMPAGVAVDGIGNIYVADTGNHTIRKITPAGSVTTLAGNPGEQGPMDGSGSAARFTYPYGIAVDGAGTVYVADTYNWRVRKVTPSGDVTTLAGSGLHPYQTQSVDGPGQLARFDQPTGIAVDPLGNVYVADEGNYTIRKITPGGDVSTFAGTPPQRGSSDGVGSGARFSGPSGVAADGAGNLYVADSDNFTVRRITVDGVVATLAGAPGQIGSADGAAFDARFGSYTYGGPRAVAVDQEGIVYVADTGNHTIRKITGGTVTTLAGNAGQPGSLDGTGCASFFYWPSGLAVDRNRNLYVADTGNHTIRKITPAGIVTTLAGSAALIGSADGAGSVARFNMPSGLVVDGAGVVYVADTLNSRIRRITPDGTVTTLAGTYLGSSDGPGSTARFFWPGGVAVDNVGNVYVADDANGTIRRITASGNVTTLGGIPLQYGGADGIGADARFYRPTGIASDGLGNLYVADTANNRITKGTPVRNRPPTVTCFSAATAECGAPVTLTIAASDLDGDAITVVWKVNGQAVQTNEVPSSLPPNSNSVSLLIGLNLGTNLIEVAATDGAGHAASCSNSVVVVDTKPPVILSVAANPSVLWPPNHQMFAVDLSAEVRDDCSPATWKIVGVTSNEPVTGPGDSGTAPDWGIAADHQVLLRAERAGSGAGRIYSIMVAATDSSGNSSGTVVTVTVPKSQGKAGR